jgi:hypothetical protein
LDSSAVDGASDAGDGGAGGDAGLRLHGALEPAEGGSRGANFQLHGGGRSSAVNASSARYRLRGKVVPAVR